MKKIFLALGLSVVLISGNLFASEETNSLEKVALKNKYEITRSAFLLTQAEMKKQGEYQSLRWFKVFFSTLECEDPAKDESGVEFGDCSVGFASKEITGTLSFSVDGKSVLGKSVTFE